MPVGLKVRVTLAAGVSVLAFALTGGATAAAAGPGPGWAIQSTALPSMFSAADHRSCEELSLCDRYLIAATNVGTRPTSGTAVVTDTLPAGIVVHGVDRAIEREPGLGAPVREMTCTEGEAPGSTRLRCEYSGTVPPGSVLAITLDVEVEPGPPHSATNDVEVTGGGAATVATAPPSTPETPVNTARPAFGAQDFSFGVYDAGGTVDTQAGDHPGALTTNIDYNTEANAKLGVQTISQFFRPVAEPKTVLVDLPLGLVGDPLAAPACPESGLFGSENTPNKCPAASRVGIVGIDVNGKTVLRDVYNVVPEPGSPAEFGFEFNEAVVLMRATVVPSAAGYMLRVAVPAVPRSELVKTTGVRLTFFGDPEEENALLRQGELEREGFFGEVGGFTPAAFLRNPTDCGTPPAAARLEMNSWVEPGRWVRREATAYEATPTKALAGCDRLSWSPALQVTPEQTTVDTPSGYEVSLTIPSSPNRAPALATPDLRNATITLPEGVVVAPGAANGLVACQELGPEGINLTHGWTPTGEQPLDPAAPEAMEIGSDNLPHVAKGHCPDASRIGSVEVTTPVLSTPLRGHVFVAQPRCGLTGTAACSDTEVANGNLFRLYLEAEGSGIDVKLEGKVSVNPATGQLTTTFEDNPQLPFTELKLKLDGGARAPLANPQACGQAKTTSVLTPWSAPESGPSATPFSSYAVSGCTSPEGFAPEFSAGTTVPNAGQPSPLTLRLSRRDGEQNLASVGVTMPLGVVGLLSHVQPCPEPQASSGTCGPASLIGHAKVAAGAGAAPFWTDGAIYLTGPYEGAPFGLSIVVPTQAGPFRLGGNTGNGTEVVRATIRVNSATAAVSVASDPLPQIVNGVPLRIKVIDTAIDRPNFIINPTYCGEQRVAGSVSGALPSGTPGATAALSVPFAASGCKNLPFKPVFTVLTQAKTSKANGAALHVKVKSGPGQANIGKVKVDLPKQLPSRLTTLQKACPDGTFKANRASCPPGSVVGSATAITPVLNHPLTGPAYLVSHAGAAFPDLVIILQGEGISLELVGNTDIKHGITISTFNSVPDAPISTFDLVLPEGPHSALAAYGSLCKSKLNMPTVITGQNGAVIKQTTRVAVAGCPKHKKARRSSTHRRATR